MKNAYIYLLGHLTDQYSNYKDMEQEKYTYAGRPRRQCVSGCSFANQENLKILKYLP